MTMAMLHRDPEAVPYEHLTITERLDRALDLVMQQDRLLRALAWKATLERLERVDRRDNAELVVRLPKTGVRWDDLERSIVDQALAMTDNVAEKAASLLGLSGRTMHYKLKKLKSAGECIRCHTVFTKERGISMVCRPCRSASASAASKTRQRRANGPALEPVATVYRPRTCVECHAPFQPVNGTIMCPACLAIRVARAERRKQPPPDVPTRLLKPDRQPNDAETRTCLECHQPLPEGVRTWRCQACSTGSRRRAPSSVNMSGDLMERA